MIRTGESKVGVRGSKITCIRITCSDMKVRVRGQISVFEDNARLSEVGVQS